MNKYLATSIKTLFIMLLTFGGTVATADSAVPAQQRPGQVGLYKAAQMSKASTPLVRVFYEYRAHANQGRRAAFEPSDHFLHFSAGRVLIDARASSSGVALLDDLNQLGLLNGTHYGDAVSGLLPVSAINRAVALPNLRSISAAIAPITNAGSVTSQGDIALRAIAARSTYGVNGTGVTVGVLSDSYDTLGGAAADVVSGDLPAAGVQVVGGESIYCGTLIFCIDEGRAMLQIIHDMAPGADLLFHTGYATKAEYANGITALAAAGADVIVDDLLYLNEPMFQDGIVAQAVDTVAASGVAYYSAAGNAGDESYEAAFDDSGVIFCIEFFLPIGDCDPIYERVGRMHDFDPGPGVDLYQSVTVPIGGVLTVALQWDGPFGGAGPKNDHDIVLLDETGGFYFEISANDNVTTREGWEVLQFINYEFIGYGTSFNIIITYDDVDSMAPPATLLKTVIFGSGNSLNEFQTNSGTLFGHANAAGAQAVGAAFFLDTPEFGISPPVLEPYSSRGGTPILFAANGAQLGSPEVRSKPEITAVDGVNTTFFFSDSHGSDGIDDFFGTSAAAPHAAGIAALMLEARPGSTPQQINTALQGSAIDMNTAGFDHDSGYGLIQADAAIADLLALGGNNPPTADFTASISGLDVTFTDTSTDSDGSITAWNWNFGDGNSASVQNPSHTYATGGTFTVAVTASDNDGGMDTTSQQLTVGATGGNAPPVASFDYACVARDCSFDSSASTDGVGINSYFWTFGDGSSSSLANPLHTYPANGIFVATLVVTDADLASDTTMAVLRVKNRGTASGSSDGDADDGGTGGKEKGRKKCTDGIDNDGDGLIDSADPDCQ
ncbi:MAG: PKD domain-containing protein [Proteobacteria bacterium]|nr:PKD domain-containing protein [Pseudomonadota bacterium]